MCRYGWQHCCWAHCLHPPRVWRRRRPRKILWLAVSCPVPPANRLGLLSPYSLLGAGVNGDNLDSNRHRTASGLAAATELAPRGTITERMTILAQGVDEASPYHDRTWLTYYGRPGIPIMGILGEYDVDELSEALKKQARARTSTPTAGRCRCCLPFILSTAWRRRRQAMTTAIWHFSRTML